MRGRSTWWWRRTRPAQTGRGVGATSPAARADRIRRRLEQLAIERLELLADERVPGRKHRLDAVSAAVADLHRDLATLEASGVPEPTTAGVGEGVGRVD